MIILSLDLIELEQYQIFPFIQNQFLLKFVYKIVFRFLAFC